jgi:hypothetical protein
MEYAKGERRIGTGDEEKDRGVLDDMKHLFAPACRQGVIEGGCKVKKHHGYGEETHADKVSPASALFRIDDEKRGCRESRDQPDAMAYTVD